jgi:hypothetical protein
MTRHRVGTSYGFARHGSRCSALVPASPCPCHERRPWRPVEGAEQADAGPGPMRVLHQLGGAIGVAVLSTVLGSGYRSRANADHLATAVTDTVHDSVAASAILAAFFLPRHTPPVAGRRPACEQRSTQ